MDLQKLVTGNGCIVTDIDNMNNYKFLVYNEDCGVVDYTIYDIHGIEIDGGDYGYDETGLFTFEEFFGFVNYVTPNFNSKFSSKSILLNNKCGEEISEMLQEMNYENFMQTRKLLNFIIDSKII